MDSIYRKRVLPNKVDAHRERVSEKASMEENGTMKTKLVCNKCGKMWKAPGNPATCPECHGENTYGVYVADEGASK
jgi:rubrerythrin